MLLHAAASKKEEMKCAERHVSIAAREQSCSMMETSVKGLFSKVHLAVLAGRKIEGQHD